MAEVNVDAVKYFASKGMKGLAKAIKNGEVFFPSGGVGPGYIRVCLEVVAQNRFFNMPGNMAKLAQDCYEKCFIHRLGADAREVSEWGPPAARNNDYRVHRKMPFGDHG